MAWRKTTGEEALGERAPRVPPRGGVTSAPRVGVNGTRSVGPRVVVGAEIEGCEREGGRGLGLERRLENKSLSPSSKYASGVPLAGGDWVGGWGGWGGWVCLSAVDVIVSLLGVL